MVICEIVLREMQAVRVNAKKQIDVQSRKLRDEERKAGLDSR